MDQYRNSEIFRGFSFKIVLIAQKFDIFSGLSLTLGDFPLIQFLLFKISGKTRAFSFEKVVFFRN
jgi:hypothetical protein